MSERFSFRQIIELRPGEWRIAVAMFAYFFLVITSFWILKPIKKTLFLAYYGERSFDLFGRGFSGPDAELLAKVMNMLVAAVAVAAFSWLARRRRRERLSRVLTFFFIAGYAVFAVALQSPSAPAVWSFYLFGDLFSTLMVAAFFAFLNDSVDAEAAKRLFGPIGFGGVLGGVFGSTVVASFIRELSVAEWLVVTSGLAVLIVVVAQVAGREVPDGQAAGEEPNADETMSAVSGDNPALAGARLVLRSSYLFSIVAVVGLYEIVSTIVDYQFTQGVVHFVPDPEGQRQHFASVFAITNWVSMLVQLLLTSFVMRRFGLGVALVLLPLSILAASSGFGLGPTLLFASALNTADNGLSYSINQSAKEALYVPTTQEEKYLAKAFIDMFVQRFAKAVAVGISLGVAWLFPSFEAVRWLSLILVPILLLWVGAALFAGRRFAELSETSSAAGEGAGARSS